MRIPKYDAQISAQSAPRFNQTVDLRSDTFSKIADGLDNYRDYRIKQLEEETKTEYYKADISAKYELEDAHSKMIDAIQNGGAYSGAEEKYQKTHDAIVQKYGKIFSGDQNAYERQMMDFKQYGLQHTVQLRNAVQARRKSDARQAYSLREQQASAKFLDNPQEAIQMMTQATAGLRGTGILTDDGAKAEIAQFVKKNTANKIQYFAQNNSTNPQAVLDLVEAEKSNLDIDTYLNLRGAAMKDVEQQVSIREVTDYMAEPAGKKQPKQESVDLFYQKEIAEKSQDMTPSQYEQSVIDASIGSNTIPTQISQQAGVYLSSDPATMSKQDMATSASLARIISETDKYASKLKSTGISKDIVDKAKILTTRMDAGMDISKALESTYMDTEESKELYKTSLTEARKILMYGRTNQQDVDVGVIPKEAKADFIDAYARARSQTASLTEAADIAKKEVNNRYKDFNGVKVKDPVTSATPYDEKSWIGAAEGYYKQKVGELRPDEKVLVLVDRESKRLQFEGKEPSYPLFIMSGETSTPIPVFDKTTGQPIRVLPDPKAMKRDRKNIFDGLKQDSYSNPIDLGVSQ